MSHLNAAPRDEDLGAVADAKQLRTPGLRFTNGMGAVGIILSTLNDRGQLEAEFTCTAAGCTTKHSRGIGEWHAASTCPDHSRAGKARKSPRLSRLMPSDSPETLALKEERNRLLEAARTSRLHERIEVKKQARIRAEIDQLKAAAGADVGSGS